MGVAAETTFLRGALDQLGIEPQLEKRYEYKTVVDGFAAITLAGRTCELTALCTDSDSHPNDADRSPFPDRGGSL